MPGQVKEGKLSYNSFMKFLVLFLASLSFADVYNPDLPKEGVVSRDTEAFIDSDINYGRFHGRATDIERKEKVLKVQVENNNTKFSRPETSFISKFIKGMSENAKATLETWKISISCWKSQI